MSGAPQLRPTPVRRSVTGIRLAKSERFYIGHALVDSCSLPQAQSAIIAHASARGDSVYVITPNAQHIVLLNKDTRLREIYRNANLVVPDGISLLFAARVFGHTLSQRVTGVDLFQSICAAAPSANLKVFFLGGLPGSADLAAAILSQRTPGLDVQTYCPPVGFETDPAELDIVASLIRTARPHILFAGLGAPKQEYWIYDHGRNLGVNVCMGVGGSFELVAGVVKRAPLLAQRLGCEWLFRLCMEPRRMWRRYLIGNLQFLGIVLNQRIIRSVFGVLARMLKISSLEAEFHSDALRAEVVSIVSRIASGHQMEKQ
jgi:N-acetylglucosaminyldiphosphoundecaprenol N-acetyl-beta-D-mannosaminyltransferase